MKWWFDGSALDDWTDGSSRSGSSLEDLALKNRAEDSQAHGDYRIKNCHSKYDRIDAILALKRSMDVRLQHLDSIYGLRQYAQPQGIGWLGLLEEWGVIRQRVLRRMKQLRNAVEHDGVDPPSLDACEDYAEVNWWFLKATTPLLTPMLEVEIGQAADHLVLKFSYKPLKISVAGVFLPEMISDSQLADWVGVENARVSPLPDTQKKPKYRPPRFGHWTLEGEVTNPIEATPLLKRSFTELDGA